MPSGGDQRLISVGPGEDEGVTAYQLAAGDELLIESVTWTSSSEGEDFVEAGVIYRDPGTGDLMRSETPPIRINAFGSQGPVHVTFARGLSPVIDSVPFAPTNDPPADVPAIRVLCGGLPDFPLRDGQIIVARMFGFDSDGNETARPISELVIVATDVSEALETDVTPPYTALSFADQEVAA